MKNNNLLGEKINFLRKDKKISLVVMSSELGIALNTLRSYECNISKPNVNILKNISVYLQADIEYFLNDEIPISCYTFTVLEENLKYNLNLATIIGKNLRKVRLSKGISGPKVANYLGINKSTISNYETGKRIPTETILCELADYFNVSIDYLFGREPLIYSSEKNDLIKEIEFLQNELVKEKKDNEHLKNQLSNFI